MFNQEEKVLPFSNGMYFVDLYGSVRDSTGKTVDTIIEDNVRLIKLDWFDGYRYYEAGLVVAAASRNISIPSKYFDKIKILYSDNDRTNVFPSNLCYRFSEKIEIEGFLGFYYIPYYNRYGISESGELLCLRYGKVKNWIITSNKNKNNRKGGYFVAVAHHDYKGHRHISRHRAMGLTFLEYDNSVLELVINHKDGIPGNDVIGNLEWVTKAQNNQHAYDNNLFTNKTTAVLVMEWSTGKITRYDSIMKCSRALGKTESFIHVRARKPDTRYSDGLVMKIDDGKPWPIFKTQIVKALEDVNILARNIFTGEVVILEGATHAQIVTGVNRATVSYHCEHEAIIPMNGFNFRYFADDIKWPNHSDKHLKIYKKYPSGKRSSGVIVRDLEGNELYFFESCHDASEQLQVPLNTILGRITKGSVVDGKTFSSFKLDENLSPCIS